MAGDVDSHSLTTIQQIFPGSSSWLLADSWESNWYPCNPSIAHGPEGYALIVTCRNGCYLGDESLSYYFCEDGGHKTRNFFTLLDDDLRPAEPWRELERPNVPIVFTGAQGIEDPRLYWQDGWMYAGTIRQHHVGGEPRVAVCSVEHGSLEILDAPVGTWVKNQMPTGMTPPFVDAMASDSNLHGGAVTRHRTGWLGIAHEIEWPERRYWHRFVVFDERGALVHSSERFSFDDFPIEFAAGIVLSGDDLVVSYGVQDREARLARIPIEEVERHCGF